MLNSVVQFLHEGLGSNRVAMFVPFSGRPCFDDGLWMKAELSRHHCPMIIRRASDQGTVLTCPDSISLIRRWISSAQADSASSSTTSSKLSMSDPASAARASVGSLNASSRSFLTSDVIAPSLTDGKPASYDNATAIIAVERPVSRTAPAQIPACRFPAPGSSEVLASASSIKKGMFPFLSLLCYRQQ